MRAPRGRASKIVNGVTECRCPLLIHNVGVCPQAAHPALENFRRTQGLLGLAERLSPALARRRTRSLGLTARVDIPIFRRDKGARFCPASAPRPPLTYWNCMNIVVVESPAKAKTINRYLGSGYEVLASFGHVRDLPAKDGSVDPEHNFRMIWEVDDKSQKRLNDIARALKGANKLILATDPDREG